MRTEGYVSPTKGSGVKTEGSGALPVEPGQVLSTPSGPRPLAAAQVRRWRCAGARLFCGS